MNHTYSYIWEAGSDTAIDMPAILNSEEKKFHPNTLGMTMGLSRNTV